MKKSLYIIFVFWALMSCDKQIDYNYFVINKCDEIISINIEITSQTVPNNGPNSVIIPPNENKLIYHGEGINGLQDRLIEHFFTKITIHKGDKISKVNYVDKNKWTFEPTSKNHANSYLTVYPEDFDDE